MCKSCEGVLVEAYHLSERGDWQLEVPLSPDVIRISAPELHSEDSFLFASKEAVRRSEGMTPRPLSVREPEVSDFGNMGGTAEHIRP